MMRVDNNYGGTLGYEPNEDNEWAEQPDFSEPPLAIEGAASHWDHRADRDYFSQPGNLFRMLNSAQRQALFGNTARSIGDVPQEIQLRHIRHCAEADPEYGRGIATALDIPLAR